MGGLLAGKSQGCQGKQVAPRADTRPGKALQGSSSVSR